MRDERRQAPEPAPIAGGPSNFCRAQVPWGLDLAAAWGWRVLVIAAAGYLLLWLVAFFAVITMPLAVALLIAALVSPVVRFLSGIGLPRGLATILVVVAGIASVGRAAHLRGPADRQRGQRPRRLHGRRASDEVKDWLKNGPLNASDSQINDYIEQAQEAITSAAGEGDIVGPAHRARRTVGHVLAGLFIMLVLAPTSSSPTASASGPGSCGCRRAPRASGSTAAAGSPGSR